MIGNEDLLREIIESPDDDAPRLVYSDWLEEHGGPERAEFIRIQCLLDKMPAEDPRYPGLRRRENELLEQHAWAWAEELGPRISAWAYRRGFVERVEMSLETIQAEILAVLQRAPIRHIRDVSQFCDFNGVVDALPHLDRLTGLEFWGLYAFDDSLLKKILASAHLSNLRTLILHHDRNGNLADEDMLVEAIHLPFRANMEELAVNVDGMWRGPSREILKAIATSPYMNRLRKLNLSNAGDEGNQPEMDLETARTLGRSPNLVGLEELDLGQTSFPIEVWDEVLKWPFLPRLKWLRLHYARQVNTPSVMTVAEIRDLRAYRRAFEQTVANVDWTTEFADPWSSNRYWTGFSWDGLRRQHLFSMWPYVERKDYDGLEAAFRADCLKYAGEAAKAIDSLPFDRYQRDLEDGLRRAIRASSQRQGTTSIYLRMRPDLEWTGVYHVSGEVLKEPFAPHEEYSYQGPLTGYGAPSFPEAAEVRDQHPAAGPLDPGGTLHYLIARTVAAFGRCLARNKAPVPVLFSCMYAVFRM